MIELAWVVPRPAAIRDADLVCAAEEALRRGGRAGAALALVLVDDERLRRMHERHLADPSRTDVIAFDLGEEGGGPVGELYVSVERAREVAARRGVSLSRELSLYVVHGVLHLCGFDDQEESDRAGMRAAEREVLDGLGFPPDPGPHEEPAEG